MSLDKKYFAKVFWLLVVIHVSVTNGATITSSIHATPSVVPQSSHSSQSLQGAKTSSNVNVSTPSTLSPNTTASSRMATLNATATTSVPGSTPVSSGGNSSGGSSTGAPSRPPTGATTGGGGQSRTVTFPTTQPPTTTPKPTTIPTTPDPCLSATFSKTALNNCANESCAEKLLDDMELFINCGKSGSEIYYKRPTSLADTGEDLALRIAKDIKTKQDNNQAVNGTVVIVTDQLAVGASTIDSSMYTNVSRGVFYFPNMSQEGVREKLGGRAANAILYPKNDLPSRAGLVQVAWSISEASLTAVPEEEIEPFRDIVWRLPVADMKIEKNKILVGKEKPKLTINSPVITFSLQPPPNTLLENPLQLAFRRLKNEDVRNHRCYFWSGTSSSGFWSSIGSSVVQSNDTHTVCAYNHMSTFVLLSEVHPERDESARKAVRIVGIVFSILAMAALIATIQMARKLECLYNDRVLIHIHICVALLIGYFLFIIGAIKNDSKVLNDILTFALHFCQLSPFAWLLMEAVYFVNTTLPLFDYENTNSRKFYMSLGWALSAAFAGGTAGYDVPHNGYPHESEIVWVFIKKTTSGYFFGPFLALFLINVLARVALVVYISMRPEQGGNDKTPLRIRVNLLTTLVLSAVIFLAWYFGVKAVNNTESKGYHYGFILLYFFQALLVFVIYGWQNEEMWSLHNKRREEAKQIEERTITFTYVP